MSKKSDRSIESIVATEFQNAETLPIWDVHNPFNFRVALEAAVVGTALERHYEGLLHNLRLLRNAFIGDVDAMTDAARARESLTDAQEIRFIALFNSERRGQILGILASGLSFGPKSEEMTASIGVSTDLIAVGVGCERDVAGALLPTLMFALD